MSKGDKQLERHTTHQRTSSVSRKKQMYAAPSVVNIPVIDENNVLNDDITADKSDSGKTLNEMNDIIKYFGLPKYTNSNVPSMNEIEFKYELETKDVRKWTQMMKITTNCNKHILDTICPGCNRPNITHDIINRLKRSIKIYDGQRKYKQMFEHMME